MSTSTQIGGKYHQDDVSLFQLKQHLQVAGIRVSHPIADSIITTKDGQGYAFDPTRLTFYDVEKDYYHEIATSDFHTVNNTFVDQYGYLGESAALEIGHAMIHAKPIVLRYPIVLKAGLDAQVAAVINNNADRFHIKNLLKMTIDEIREFTVRLPTTCEYKLNKAVQAYLQQSIKKLFAAIPHDEV